MVSIRAIVSMMVFVGAAAHLRAPSGMPSDIDVSNVHSVAERKKMIAAHARQPQPVRKLTKEELDRAENAIKNADAELQNADNEILDGKKMLEESHTRKH